MLRVLQPTKAKNTALALQPEVCAAQAWSTIAEACAQPGECTIAPASTALGPPAWWWSGLAACAAVEIGGSGEGLFWIYIGASVAVVATRRLMGQKKRPPTKAEAAALDAIRADLQTPFDEERHGALLKKLWTAGLDGTFARRSTKWQALGFQGDDPVTDLRACNVLGLKTLVTFLEGSPRYAHAILASRRITGAFDPKAPGFYPVACAGIEVCAFLCECAGLWGAHGAPPPATQPDSSHWAALVGTPEAFGACFALCLRALDRRFADENADYMGFSSVRDAVFAEVKDALDAGPASAVERCLHLAPGAWGATAPDFAGALEKLPSSSATKRLVSKWQRRHFVLRGSVLAVLKCEDAARAEACGELRAVFRLGLTTSVKVHRDRLTIENLTHDGRRAKLCLRGDLGGWAAALERAVPSDGFSDDGDEPVVSLD